MCCLIRRPLIKCVVLWGYVVLFVLGGAWPLAISADAPSAPRWMTLVVAGETAYIYRDEYGVPHCFGPTNRALFYASGYAVAQDRLWQLDLFRRTARGTLAEILGTGAVASDRYERRHGYTEAEYEAIFAQLPAEVQEVFTAYRDGINACLAEALAAPASKLPWEFHELGYQMAPWQVTDSLAIGCYMARRFGEQGGLEVQNQALLQTLTTTYGLITGTAMFEDLRWLNDPAAPVSVPQGGVPSIASTTSPSEINLVLPDIDRVAEALTAEQQAVQEVWARYGIPRKLGSYAWAVSPERSATGHALLYGGPQMFWSTPEIVYEIQLTGGQGFDVAGIGFAGLPLVFIGHNRDIAWSITSGVGDNTDTFVETLNPANLDEYWYDGSWRGMIIYETLIAVRGQSAPVVEVVRHTVHGPVIYLDTAHNLAYSLKRASWMQEHAMLRTFLNLMRAQGLDQFGQAVGEHTVSNNFVYADRAGNIAYWQAGSVPMRADGSYVGRFPWRGDGTQEWRSSFRAIPHIVNPAQGYVANWNNKPSVDFDNGDGQLLGKQNRVQDIQELLAAKNKISWDDMRAIPMQIGAFLDLGNETRYVRSYLLAAIDAEAPDDAQLRAVAVRLAAWDGKLVTDVVSSTVMVPEEKIWYAWLDQIRLDTFGDELGSYWTWTNLNTLLHALEGASSGVPPARDYFDDIYTSAHETANSIIVGALRKALQNLTTSYHTSNIDAWVEPRPVITLTHSLGRLMGQIPASNRSTYGQVIELGTPIVAENILPMGQSGFISPEGVLDAHFSDQAELYRQFRYKPMRLVDLTIIRLPVIMKFG